MFLYRTMLKADKYLKNGIIAATLGILCHIMWGSMFAVIKKCYELFHVTNLGSTYLIAAIRFIAAGILLLLFYIICYHRFPKVSKEDLLKLLLVGTVQVGFTYYFQFTGLAKASSINCSIINGTQIIITNIFAHFLFKDDKFNIRKIIGSVVIISGVLFCFLYDAKPGNFTILGEGFMFFAIINFCLGTNLSRKYLKHMDPILIGSFTYLIGGFELFIPSLICGGHLEKTGVEGWFVLGILVIVAALCHVLWTALNNANSIGKMAPYQCMNPLAGALLSSILLGDNVFQVKFLVAFILVTAGILISNLQKTYQLKK